MTIKYKLLLLTIGTFIIATISILVVVDKQYRRSIDENQYTLYNERIDSILGLLHGYDGRLKMTGQAEVYSDGFKESAIDTLKKTSYRQQNQRIFPFIINHDNKLVMFPDFLADNISLTKSELISTTLSFSNKKSGSFEFKERWYLYKHFASWDWMVVYTVPMDIKYSEVQGLSRVLLLIMLTIATLSTIIMWLAVIRITKPLEVLAESTKAIAAGNYSSAIEVTGSDEIGRLASDFNQMAGSVNKTIVELNREIGERQQAEKNLDLSNRRYRTLFQNAPIALWEEDFTAVYQYLDTLRDAGVKDFHEYSKTEPSFIETCAQNVKILDVNREVLKLHGAKTKEELLGNLENIFTGKSFETFKDEVIALSKGSLEFESEGEVKSLSGEKINIIVKMTLSRELDGTMRAIITTIDITDRLQLEEQLRQAQKMESIGTLAGGIAHDFNNLLSVILGFTEMAKDDCQPGSSIAKDLDEVLGAGNRAKGLVQQILAFSRQDETERIILQPASIVKETITMLRPSLPTTIEITQDIDAVTGLVFVDPTQLNQILMNLCTNAFHAMEDTGGKLDISLKEVTLSNEDLEHEPDVTAGSFIQLSVGDSGTGIAPTVKDKIFDPYFTTKETGKGTGMGLSMVHGIVKNYGGFISLYSELGEGTIFHVFLPTVEKEPLTESEINDQIPIGKERILFVDDEEILTKMGKNMLERLGYHVTVRNSSLEALETFQNQPDTFDVVITDQTMPGMMGSDLSRRMLQIRPDIPIILCTGYSTIISEEKAKSMGIKEFAFKPLAKKDIAKLIRKVLDVS